MYFRYAFMHNLGCIFVCVHCKYDIFFGVASCADSVSIIKWDSTVVPLKIADLSV